MESGAAYISDLHYPPYNARAIALAARLAPGDIAVEVWNDALEYLLSHAACASAEEASAAFARAAAQLEDMRPADGARGAALN